MSLRLHIVTASKLLSVSCLQASEWRYSGLFLRFGSSRPLVSCREVFENFLVKSLPVTMGSVLTCPCHSDSQDGLHDGNTWELLNPDVWTWDLFLKLPDDSKCAAEVESYCLIRHVLSSPVFYFLILFLLYCV